jgi:flagellar capping protein FliD
MSEINTNPNRIAGLASGLNTNQTIEGLLQIERKRLEPVEQRKKQTEVELESFDQVKTSLDELKTTVETLSTNAVWEGKLVESSDENIVTATATAGARPGKHTLVVDKLALNHQISSQGYATTDENIGAGRFVITVGEDPAVTVVVDETNNTLQGLKDAINSATKDVQATIIKTGNQLKPNQLVLTSQKTGSAGRITLDIQLRGGEAPNFANFVETPSEWAGVGEPGAAAEVTTGTGASNAIIRAVGEYTGEEDKSYNFTAVQTGTIGGEGALQVRWKASTGESGVLELDAFNYAPGEAVPFADGLSLIFSQGDVIVGDSFSLEARAEKSDLYWWLSPELRSAGYTQPTRWDRQDTFGGPKISGEYQGEDDTEFTLTVEGSGQIGTSKDLAVRWESANGESGILRVGRGYGAGTPLALVDGLTLSLDPGVLNDGDTATFSATASKQSTRWWLEDDERNIPAKIENVSKWVPTEKEEEVDPFTAAAEAVAFPEELGPRISSSEVKISGEYNSDEAKVYTFTVLRDGSIGTTKDLAIKWEDDKGNSGQVSVGDTYQQGQPLPFDSGLLVAFGPGQVFKDDSFTVRTQTSTIQPAQDAKVRLGATEFGGGLTITSTTNELDDVIEGVKLRLVSTSENPVTITIKGDTEKAIENTLLFAENFNNFAVLVNELTKFDQENQIAGPLLSNRDVDNMRRTLTTLLINPVGGLPTKSNMVFNIGLKLNDQGTLEIDESALRSKIADDFGAVADLFRNRGVTGNSAVDVVGVTDDTKPNPDGYPVEITQLATQGAYTTPSLAAAPIIITEQNNRFYVSVDGRQSEPVTLEPGVYAVDEYAGTLQNAITNDPVIGNRKVRVSHDGERIRVQSGTYGASSGIEFAPVAEDTIAAVGLTGGESVKGQDVAGTIDGQPAQALGQILRGPDESENLKGLRLFVTLTENQLSPSGPEALVKVTKGVASRMSSYLNGIVDPLRGEMKRITDGLRTRLKGYNEQLERITQRIERKRSDLQTRFTRLETQMATLKSQQNYMSSQLGGLGGGSVLPGLPKG